jgi:hypothetical protein
LAERYLLPEDVGPSDAAEVLAFLNAATSAEEIAAAVEIPGELDIGPRVAARILARRDELRGFTRLEQVYAVPYVGPERFTELVTSLSAARPPRPQDGRVDPALLARLTERLDALEALAQPTPTIRLHTARPVVWLGQEIALLGQVKDARGRALIDQPVTFVTTWGQLRGRAGTRLVSGNTITLRSDHLGLCRLRLAPALGVELTAIEESSLAAALATLPTDPASPRDSLAGLTELARRYRAAGNDALRRALDAYYQRYGSPEQGDAPVDSLSLWPLIEVTLLALLTPAPETATGQLPTTLLNLRQRNWFYAWTLAFRQLLEQESKLAGSLEAVAGGDRQASGFLTDLLGRVSGFMAAQQGLVGRLVGQEFAQSSLNRFVQTGLAKVAPSERTALLTGVASGIKSLSGGSALFSALEASRSGVDAKIDSRLAGVDQSATVGELAGRLAQLEQAALTRDELLGITRDILDQAGRDAATLIDTLRAGFDTALAAKADVTRVDVLEASFSRALAGKANTSQVYAVSRQVSTLQDQGALLNATLNNLNTRLDGVDSSISDLNRTVVRRPG